MAAARDEIRCRARRRASDAAAIRGLAFSFFCEVSFSKKRQRRDIFVDSNPVLKQAPPGAAYSDDVTPDGAKIFADEFYKDSAPTALANGKI